MFRNDYVMRLIEQFGNALGVLLGLKKQMKPQEAMELVGETYKRLFGLNPNLIRALSERDLTDLLNRDGEATAEKMLIVAGLIKEEADLCAILERPDEAYRLNLKALNLTLMAAGENDAAEWLDVHGQVEELLTRLSGYELPAETKQLLWTYYDSVGRFADAEDILFDLLDRYGADRADQAAYEQLLEQAEQFYERLLILDEDALEAGRLPLDEVQDSLEEVKARASELDRDGP
ncbi:hypothetical protein FE783_19445 [Paenibacillus mesophilus]|uniref:DUF6483 family protein n=1 Tax=Paenibacillus mesophilus TaxID=2582849 RepID=UPI00110DCECA|nr:DUF6483 family protein [Paenibacillus mesophilus]TMV48128.1 hypothetical protein FE783_19445 [Paenibacillus mesophilus]